LRRNHIKKMDDYNMEIVEEPTRGEILHKIRYGIISNNDERKSLLNKLDIYPDEYEICKVFEDIQKDDDLYHLERANSKIVLSTAVYYLNNIIRNMDVKKGVISKEGYAILSPVYLRKIYNDMIRRHNVLMMKHYKSPSMYHI
jgi:uncharacterized protein (UPF0128 family)